MILYLFYVYDTVKHQYWCGRRTYVSAASDAVGMMGIIISKIELISGWCRTVVVCSHLEEVRNFRNGRESYYLEFSDTNK